jgi:tetratricopeptide (TPR) repeat protein
MFQHSTASRLKESNVYWRKTSESHAFSRRMCRFVLGALATLFVCSFLPAWAGETSKPTRRLDEASLRPLMTEGVQAVRARKLDDAVKIFNEIDQKFRDAYAGGPRVYCSRGPKETVLYLTKSTAMKGSAIAIGSLWCDAIYLKAYSLTELRRPADAAKELDRVLKMAPNNSQYLNERAHLLTKARDFVAALAMYKQAEQDSALTPNQKVANEMKSKACRGIGYVLTEMGKLDESETNYMRCLTIDPSDQKSKRELAYIAWLKARLKARKK